MFYDWLMTSFCLQKVNTLCKVDFVSRLKPNLTYILLHIIQTGTFYYRECNATDVGST